MTLLEVMIAMIITASALLMLLNMAMIALEGNNWANKTTLATQLVQEKLEQLRGGAAGALEDGSDTTHGLARSWTVTDIGNHLQRVDVTISWDDYQAKQHSNTLTGYIRTD